MTEVYVYQADLWCKACGEQLCQELTCPGDPEREYTYDSDAYPKGPTEVDLHDTVYHCASGSECCNAIELGDGEGTVGKLLTERLTEEGRRRLEQQCEEGAGRTALLSLWEEELLEE